MTELTMPKLSDSMEEGTILTWLRADGDQIEAGEELLEIETDKATVTHAAETGGVLQILAPEGTTLPVGAPIARVGAAAESASGPAGANGNSGAAEAPARSGHVSDGAADPAVATAARTTLPSPDGAAVRATPLARRIAAAHGVPLEQVAGSGPLGRVTRGDVLSKAGIAIPEARPAPPPTRTAVAEPSPPTGKGTVEVLAPTRVQAVIAGRMAEANRSVPHFQVQTDVVMDAIVEFRAQIKRVKETGADVPSFNDLIVKAAALALRDHPLANAAYLDGRFEVYSRINVGIAVAAERALVVPTIFDADQKTVGTIAAESRQLAERVRRGVVTPAELSGATFTVSNLGMYGMSAITPVINLPQAAILGVGAVREVLARVDDRIVDRRLMTLTLSCDHRILYGADAAEFLAAIRELLEQPLKLVL